MRSFGRCVWNFRGLGMMCLRGSWTKNSRESRRRRAFRARRHRRHLLASGLVVYRSFALSRLHTFISFTGASLIGIGFWSLVRCAFHSLQLHISTSTFRKGVTNAFYCSRVAWKTCWGDNNGLGRLYQNKRIWMYTSFSLQNRFTTHHLYFFHPLSVS